MALFVVPLMSRWTLHRDQKLSQVPQSFCWIGETGDGSVWVHWSVTTEQEQSKHHRERRDQVAPPQWRSRWGDASNPGRGQARGQQLLLEGEVVHCQVISQVWVGDRQRRWQGGIGEQWKIWERQGKRMETIRTSTVTKAEKHMWYVCPRPARCLTQL